MMKKNIIALAVASAIAAPVAMADAPTVYGQFNMAIDQMSVKDSNGDKVKASSGTQVNARNNNFGIKGSTDLGDGLKAVYQMEFAVNTDKSDTLGNRNQFVGLSGGFGTVLLGRHDTPFKMAQAKDFFNDGQGDISKLADGLGAFKKGGENRVSNVLAYVSPSFGGVKIVGAFVPKETGGNTDKESSLTDLMSFAAMYGSKKKGLYLSAAMDMASKSFVGANGNTTAASGDGESINHLRVTAQYAVAGLTANAMYQDFSGKGLDTTTQKGSTMSVAVAYKMGKFQPKATVMMVDRDKNAAGDKYKDSTNYGIGLDYAMAKTTTAYVEYVNIDHKGGAVDTKASQSALSVGLITKF